MTIKNKDSTKVNYNPKSRFHPKSEDLSILNFATCCIIDGVVNDVIEKSKKAKNFWGETVPTARLTFRIGQDQL